MGVGCGTAAALGPHDVQQPSIFLQDAARRRRALGVVERMSIQVHVVVHAPAEVLVEGRGRTAEHPCPYL